MHYTGEHGINKLLLNTGQLGDLCCFSFPRADLPSPDWSLSNTSVCWYISESHPYSILITFASYLLTLPYFYAVALQKVPAAIPVQIKSSPHAPPFPNYTE